MAAEPTRPESGDSPADAPWTIANLLGGRDLSAEEMARALESRELYESVLNQEPDPQEEPVPLLPFRLVPEREEVIAAAERVPMLSMVDALHRELLHDPVEVHSESGPTLEDGLRLARALGTDSDVVSARAAELTGLVQVFALALAAEAIHYEGDWALASGHWLGQSPELRWQRIIDAAMQMGPASLACGGYTPVDDKLVEAADVAAVHVVALLWVDPRGADVMEAADLVETVYDELHGRGLAGLEDPVGFGDRMVELFTMLTALGIVVWDDEIDRVRLAIECGPMVSHWMREAELAVVLPEDIAALSAAELLNLATRRNGSEIVQQVWLSARTVDQAAKELLEEMKEHPLAANVAVGGSMLESLGDQVIPWLREALDTSLAPQMWLSLVNLGAVTPEEVPSDMALAAGMDMLLAMVDMGAPYEMIETFRNDVPEGGEDAFITDVMDTEHPRAGELLELIGRHHPDPEMADRLLQGATEWRLRAGPAVY